MPRVSTTFSLRLAAAVALAVSWIVLRDSSDISASTVAGFDPDQRFVLESALPSGEFSFESPPAESLVSPARPMLEAC
jgi:hypothetical protein